MLVELAIKMEWASVTVISGFKSEHRLTDFVLHELQARDVYEVRFVHYGSLVSGRCVTGGLVDSEARNVTPIDTNKSNAVDGTRDKGKGDIFMDLNNARINSSKTSVEVARSNGISLQTINRTEPRNAVSDLRVTTESSAGRVRCNTSQTERYGYDDQKAANLLHAAVNVSNHFVVYGPFSVLRQIIEQVSERMRESKQKYKFFYTQWLTVVPEDRLGDLHQAVNSYEHVVAVVYFQQKPLSLWTLQRSGDSTQMRPVTSQEDSFSSVGIRHLLPNLFQGLSGRTLRIAIKERSYYLLKEGDTYKGILMDLLQELCFRLNFSYTLQESPDDSWGQELDTGQWDGLIGMLTREEVDLGVGSFSRTAERSAVADDTTAFFYDHARLIFRQSQPPPNIWTFFLRPFDPLMYVLIVICFLLILLLLQAIQYCRPGKEGSGRRHGVSKWVRSHVVEWSGSLRSGWRTSVGEQPYAYGFQSGPGTRFGPGNRAVFQAHFQGKDPRQIPPAGQRSAGQGSRPLKSVSEWMLDLLHALLAGLFIEPQEYEGRSNAGRLLVLSWLLFSAIMIALYGGELTATLTVPNKNPPFTSLAQLVSQTTYSWGIASGTAKSSIISESTQADHQKFHQGVLQFEKYDNRVTSPDLEVQKEKVMTENYAFFTGSSDLFYEWRTESCDISMISETYFKTDKVFYLQKGSPYTKIISDEITRMYETGSIAYWTRAWTPRNPVCGHVISTDPIDSGGSVTGLTDIQSAFYLAAIGVGAAALTLAVELIFSTRRSPFFSRWK